MRVTITRIIPGVLLVLTILPVTFINAARGAEPSADAVADAAKLTDEQVVASMKRSIDFLLKSKTGDNWEPERDVGHRDNGGLTALVLYSLLHAGQSLDDDPIASTLNFHSPELAPAIKYLAGIQPVATYTTALQANALTLFHRTPETTAALKADHDYFLRAIGDYGGYDYEDRPVLDEPRNYFALQQRIKDIRANAIAARDRGDAATVNTLAAEFNKISVTVQQDEVHFSKDKGWSFGNLSTGQYGTLGAWALADEGIEFPSWYWEATDKFWRICQQKDGSWHYDPRSSDAGDRTQNRTMTTAGLASLYIAAEYTDLTLRLENREDSAIASGLKKLTADFDPLMKNYYYTYGIERVGLSSGYKFLGTKDWYREIAAEMIRLQQPDGVYRSDFPGCELGNTRFEVTTAYGLLFLARGRNPVVFNKLQYDGNCWDARPRDDANITRWMSKAFERPINWQIVNLDVDAEEWTDAPVLLITGSGVPNFKDADIAKLRAYINAGGTIFSTADGASKEFTESIRKIAAKVVNNQYEMRVLPPDHVLYSQSLWTKISNPPRMMGMSNGIRELWIHSPSDMGANWQLRKFSVKEDFDIPANLYFYASGKTSLHSKLRSLAVAAPTDNPKRTITVGRLTYTGNWDPEPGAWQRFAKIAATDFHTNLKVVPVEFAALDPATTQLVHLTGSTAFTFSPDDTKKLKAYLDGGGTLFADAGGGNSNFSGSFVQMSKNLYPESTLEPIPADDPIFSGKLEDSVDTQEIELRKYAASIDVKGKTPQFLGIRQHGRWIVIFSPYDVSSGFLGTNTWGILGYTPQSSQNLARNIILYAAGGKSPAAATPATDKNQHPGPN